MLNEPKILPGVAPYGRGDTAESDLAWLLLPIEDIVKGVHGGGGSGDAFGRAQDRFRQNGPLQSLELRLI